MTSIKLTVSGVEVQAQMDGILTTGMVGIPVAIEYDSVWDGLTKNLVCRSGAGTRTVLDVGNAAFIPHEVMEPSRNMYCVDRLEIGVEGFNSDGTLVIPTLWAVCGDICPGATSNADPSADPELPVYMQLNQRIKDLEQKESVSGENGGYYIPEVSQPEEETLQFNFVPSMEAMPDVEPVQVNLPGGSRNVALSTEQINALDGMFKVCAFIKEDVSAEYTAFQAAFGITNSGSGEVEPDAPDESAKTLERISVTYTGGDVYASAELTDLTGITVTAIYSDGSTKYVTDYTLSGTIEEGENIITVSYGGKTAEFTVTAFVSGEEGTSGNDAPFDTLVWTDTLRITRDGTEYENQAQYSTSDYADISEVSSITIATAEDTPSGNIKYTVVYYDSEKTVITDGSVENYINANNSSFPNTVTLEKPEGAGYCRICGNLNQYSKLITKVRLRTVSGHARQNIVGKVPEGIWMEMAGALNNLEFRITDIETDGFKVGGFIPIDNYILKDSDVALGEEIMYMLGQAIGYALDKAIVFGLGPTSKMPVGIVTRLAQTQKPVYWGQNQGDWTDLHSSNVLQLNLAALEGTAFFIPFLTACAKAKPTFSTDGKIWIMNDATRQDILIRALAFNANAALMSGIENTMPVVGGEIITLEFMPDHMVVGGYGDEYLLVERDGGTFASSDAPLFLLDKTAFKGTARYDGQPVSGEAFMAQTYDNSVPVAKMSFATDYVNTSPNALIVTSSAGAAGTTKLTVAGAVNASNKLMACIGAPASIAKGEVPGKGWTVIVSGTTALNASTGMGATVVELDDQDKVISIGYCASVAAGA